MSKNTGKEYELLVKSLIENMAKEDSVQTRCIEHNKILQGKSVTHQIDVLWEFIGPLKRKCQIIIEAKDYKQKVTQEKIMAFKSVVDDLPGRPIGLYITKTGYQSGAKQFAKDNDILLYEFRHPTEDDWKGKMKTIQINLIGIWNSFSSPEIEVDSQWIILERQKMRLPNLPKNSKFLISGYENEIFLCDELKNKLISLYELKTKLSNEYLKNNPECKSFKIQKTFDTLTLLTTMNEEMPYVKINKISYDVTVNQHHKKIVVDGASIVKFILKNLQDGTVKNMKNL